MSSIPYNCKKLNLNERKVVYLFFGTVMLVALLMQGRGDSKTVSPQHEDDAIIVTKQLDNSYHFIDRRQPLAGREIIFYMPQNAADSIQLMKVPHLFGEFRRDKLILTISQHTAGKATQFLPYKIYQKCYVK